MNKRHVYPSAVDWWWMVPLMIVFVYVSFADIISKFQQGCARDGWIAVGVVIFVALLFPTIIIPCRYTLMDDGLFIQSGLLKKKIDYRSMRDVKPSLNPLSAPALSLRRVKITLDKGFALVSPKRRDEFIVELKRRIYQARGANPRSGSAP
jgi:membrane protein YdbS with pleckstrin-like domain